MEIDLPEVVAEVRAAFDHYEKGLNANDVDVLDASFWNDPRTIRYSLTDNGYGFAAIHASRLARPRTDMTRTIMHTVIITFGRDLATANTCRERASLFPAHDVGRAKLAALLTKKAALHTSWATGKTPRSLLEPTR